jgi:hypothetical protein
MRVGGEEEEEEEEEEEGEKEEEGEESKESLPTIKYSPGDDFTCVLKRGARLLWTSIR